MFRFLIMLVFPALSASVLFAGTPQGLFDPGLHPYSMLIGEGTRGAVGASGYYSPDYGMDDYQPFEKLIAKDHFNTFVVVANDEGSGGVAWETAVPGWTHKPGGNQRISYTR